MFLVISSKESSIVIPVKYERECIDDNKAFNMCLNKYSNNKLISIIKPFIDRKTKYKHTIALLLLPSGTTEITFDIISD